MTNIEPFGNNESEPTVQGLGQQHFLGLTVVNFTVNSSWDSQGGQCSIELIQDAGEYLEEVVVGSPQYFEIATTGNQPVFRFYGILKELSRNASAQSKTYSAVLQSPTIILDACTTITEGYAGYGYALEAYGPNVPARLDFGSYNSSWSPLVFNVQNIFGMFENEQGGFSGAGFGKSVINEDGIRADMFAAALHELVNGNPLYTPRLGSNILYGVNAYSGGYAYSYNVDILGFMNSIINYIPNDFRVKSTNLLEFVNEICSQINFSFYVDLKKPVGAGKAAFSGPIHETTVTPTQTHANTVYGGQIHIVVQNNNVAQGVPFPLSSGIIANEISDKPLGGYGPDGSLPLDMGLTGNAHPNGVPVASSPYGGEFPVESINTNDSVKWSSTNLSVRLNESAVGAKVLVGGYQSRINYVSTAGINRNKQPEIINAALPDADMTADVWAYYGTINISARVGGIVPNVPVLCDLLPTTLPHIPIDVFDLYGDLTLPTSAGRNAPIINGIYFASSVEMTYAKLSYEDWMTYLSQMNLNTLASIKTHFGNVYSFPKQPIYNLDGSLSPYGRAVTKFATNMIWEHNTSSQNTNKITNVDNFTAAYATTSNFLKRLYERIKHIADTHYGKTYAVKCPAFNTAPDNDLNTYKRSWELSSDAYLEPSNYQNYEAPYNSAFISNGRLKAYCVYYANTSNSSLSYYPGKNTPVQIQYKVDNVITDALTGKTYYSAARYYTPDDFNFKYVNVEPDFSSAPRDSKLDFGKNPNELFTQSIANTRSIINIPIDVSEDYTFVPAAYFTFNSIEHLYPPVGQNILGNVRAQLNDRAYSFANFLKQLVMPANGAGCVPFAIVTTDGCFEKYPYNPPLAKNSSEMDGTDDAQLKEDGGPDSYIEYAIHPKAFGIPQQSTRYVYGPWFTNTIPTYGFKVEYVQDTNLVPENYIFPINANIGGINTNINSGYSGMNAVAQLMANTIDGFDYLSTEEGSVTIPGAPIITHIGQALVVGGPLVTDISINLAADSLSTQYSMKTYAPKFDRANKFVIDRLTKLARQGKL